MNARIMTLAAALLCTALAACGGPDLSSAEASAKSYQKALFDQRVARGDEELARMKWKLDCMEAMLPWYADKSAAEKELKEERAEYDFIRSNIGELNKYELEIVGVSEQKEGDKVVGKRVEIRVKRKGLDKKGDSGTEFQLKDKDYKTTIVCTQLEGKWKIKGEE